MVEKRAASNAGNLIRRARGVTIRHHLFRAACRGVTAGALVAAALVATAGLLGHEPGAWLALAVLPAIAAFSLGLRHARTTLSRAALLLDRAAGTKERFLATLTAVDPEVRDLAAEQAMAEPSVADEPFPLRFPPTTEGLAAAFATAILVGALLLSSDRETPPGSDLADRAVSALPGRPGDAPGSLRGSEIEFQAEASLPARVDQVTRRMAAGEEIDAEDWKALEQAGLAKKVRGEVAAALSRGEPGQAAAAVRRALGRGRVDESPDPVNSTRAADWETFRRALEAPVWSPRYDAVVRRYFSGAGDAGLR